MSRHDLFLPGRSRDNRPVTTFCLSACLRKERKNDVGSAIDLDWNQWVNETRQLRLNQPQVQDLTQIQNQFNSQTDNITSWGFGDHIPILCAGYHQKKLGDGDGDGVGTTGTVIQ